ncbi:MAG: LEA type 2 family protein [Deltaproteobacteria bacterium]|nr:LEA type 2 family protein [Deltaproteobacteria bacterium]
MRRYVVSAWIVILVVLVSGCASLFWMGEKPHVDIVNITPKEMRLLEQTFLMELRIQNPTETDLDITGMSFELEINGQPFARGVSNQSLKVERLSTQLVQVDAYTGLVSILRQLSEAKKGSSASGFKYRLKGSIHTGAPSFRIPFDETGEFK